MSRPPIPHCSARGLIPECDDTFLVGILYIKFHAARAQGPPTHCSLPLEGGGGSSMKPSILRLKLSSQIILPATFEFESKFQAFGRGVIFGSDLIFRHNLMEN